MPFFRHNYLKLYNRVKNSREKVVPHNGCLASVDPETAYLSSLRGAKY